MFANHPELLITMLLCEVMENNEALEFIGFRKLFRNKGYGWSLSYDGVESQQYQYDENNRANEDIVAIDAIAYASEGMSLIQFGRELIDRDILKAYAGFANAEASTIVTGNWGCGVFNGNIPLKFMIQWVACSLAGKEMVYVPFGHGQKVNKAEALSLIANHSAHEVYAALINVGGQVKDTRTNIIELLSK